MERESIGIFISEHPLKRVSAAMQVKADCTISELSDRATASGARSAA